MKLTLKPIAHAELPKKLLDEASRDPWVKSHLGEHKMPAPRMLILRGKTSVGFFTPKAYEGGLVLRPAFIYVLQKERRKGIAKEAVEQYLGKRGGLAYVNPKNETSTALFTSLGFNPVPDDEGRATPRWTREASK